MAQSTMNERIEPRADQITWLTILAFLLISLLVLSITGQTELPEGANQGQRGAVWIDEATSHLTILIATFAIPLWLSRFPLFGDNWLKQLPIYLLCFLAFSIFHIAATMGLRNLLYPPLLGFQYGTSLLSLEVWIYELSKDFMTFLIFLGVFLTSRQLAQYKLEANTARHEARTTGQITLKSGGRLVFLNAEEILYAKSAGNYVEVFTDKTKHLARMTMSSLETLLDETGGHLRVHRSYVVRKNAISVLEPNGEGEAVLTLTNEATVPVSRKHRASVTTALASAAKL